MRPRRRIRSVALGGAVMALAFAAPAGAATHHVAAGGSIQAAIDAASPGDTIVVAAGHFRENLTIRKDDVKLRGAGSGESGTVLSPTSPATPSECIDPSDPSSVNGICVLGEVDFATGATGRPVHGVTIEDVRIDGFPAFGVFAFNASDLTVDDTVAVNNGAYGISGFVLAGVRFRDDVAKDNGAPGFYIGDSPNADAEVVGNEAIHNGVGFGEGFGILIRDSNHGVVRDNEVEANCVGITLIDTGENTDVGVSDWTVTDNDADANNGACPSDPEEGGPTTSGTGIFLGGTNDVTVRHNEVEDHAPTLESPFSAGITVASTTQFGGADPTDNDVVGNDAEDNRPYDIRWDGTGSGNRFRGNDCDRSTPGRICD